MHNILHPKLPNHRRQAIARRGVLIALALALLGCPWLARAQYTGQAKSSRLRAVGVLRIDARGRARLFPVVLYADGKYYDARLYQANPVPLAIASDILYEGQKNGLAEGSFTVQNIMHTTTQWWAEGLWRAAPPPGDTKAVKPVAEPRDSDRPVLHRPTSSSSSAQAEDPDRPVLHRPSDSSSTSSSSTAKKPDEDADRPTLHRPSSPAGETAEGGRSSSAGADSAERAEARDPDRPTLRRGKPTREMQPDLPGNSVAGQGRAAAVSETPPAAASDHVLLAVADAGLITAHPFTYAWKAEERERDLAALQSLAVDAIRQAAQQRADLRGFEVSGLTELETNALDPDYSNRPIEILTASVTAARAKNWIPAGSVLKTPPRIKLTLVARKNSEGKLRQIFCMISDPLMLDVRPSLEFLGAVDADGSGRAQLLFRQQVDVNSFSYALYRPTPYDLVKIFETAPAE
jgi:hypothetical protein